MMWRDVAQLGFKLLAQVDLMLLKNGVIRVVVGNSAKRVGVIFLLLF